MKDKPKFIIKPLSNPVDMEEFKKAWEEANMTHGLIFFDEADADEFIAIKQEFDNHKCEAAVKNSENGLCQRYCRICGKDM